MDGKKQLNKPLRECNRMLKYNVIGYIIMEENFHP
jgi:hypothetical protein